MIGSAIELLLVPLLVVTSVWCALVFRRLHALRADREELAAFLEALGRATARAERAVEELRAAGAEAAASWAEQEKKALAQRQELDRTVEGGGRILRRLEEMVGQGARIVAELRTARDMRQPSCGERRESAPATVEGTARTAEPPSARAGSGDLLEALKKLR
ncbi:MAG: DUF6468 domain-containing protein [Geminicoccaceae bacterium]|nr:DUF6468 domain-containing protein [Geminicoccaceae bacterium]MCS7268356.1 DUF6468 domain-containing protein [Geminicoccaceae bacterium]MDW8124249.1 DUF6468 domain-containing protein [Geminicoccaceae bacterium]